MLTGKLIKITYYEVLTAGFQFKNKYTSAEKECFNTYPEAFNYLKKIINDPMRQFNIITKYIMDPIIGPMPSKEYYCIGSDIVKQYDLRTHHKEDIL